MRSGHAGADPGARAWTSRLERWSSCCGGRRASRFLEPALGALSVLPQLLGVSTLREIGPRACRTLQISACRASASSYAARQATGLCRPRFANALLAPRGDDAGCCERTRSPAQVLVQVCGREDPRLCIGRLCPNNLYLLFRRSGVVACIASSGARRTFPIRRWQRHAKACAARRPGPSCSRRL